MTDPIKDRLRDIVAKGEADAMKEAIESGEHVEVGDDGRARLEKDMGLDIDPKTGRAYESQGDFANLGLGTNGRFHNGVAVPRVARCAACDTLVAEQVYGQGFMNCGAFDFGGQWFICSECILKTLRLFPRLRALIAAKNGGDLRAR